ncbi:metallophosphoesterase family protein [Vibrio quintilis]|uniref:Phosphodiesterase n=1 Tax=Vibrio quintilis TaxID=1117707 RepID=A0A1M7YWI4_9VIBR|nr:metallophosphoesterase family protein [Vibrio quintilis]SHO57017.1 phosphodiesterase [Vibrio quintilis]
MFGYKTIEYQQSQGVNTLEKFAVLSDIHSNIYALEAVVADAKSRGATTLINLGDILYGPIAPRATYDCLQTLDVITISGNQDRQIYEATQDEIDANPTMQFILDDLGDAPLAWMKQLPFDKQITTDIYACHGTPEDDLVYLLEDTRSGKPELKPDQEIIRLLNGITAPVILCGHTHLPRCVELSTHQLVINPGSIGLQAYTDDEPHLHSMQNYTAKASYAILEEATTAGQWQVSFHRIPYDVQSAVRAARKRGRKDWEHFLLTGRKL